MSAVPKIQTSVLAERRVTASLVVTREVGGNFALDIPGEEVDYTYEVTGVVTSRGDSRVDTVFNVTTGLLLTPKFLTEKEMEAAHDLLLAEVGECACDARAPDGYFRTVRNAKGDWVCPTCAARSF